MRSNAGMAVGEPPPPHLTLWIGLQHRATVQGHSGSVVCRQAAEHLILWFSQWRKEAALGEVAERRIKLTVKLLSTYSLLENTESSRRFASGCVYTGGQSLDIK